MYLWIILWPLWLCNQINILFEQMREILQTKGIIVSTIKPYFYEKLTIVASSMLSTFVENVKKHKTERVSTFKWMVKENP